MGRDSEYLDILLVGGGLQSGLIAFLCRQFAPDLRLGIVEQAGELFGNHTWCFHQDDVPGELEELFLDLVDTSWDSHLVRFEGHERRLSYRYSMLSAERFRRVFESLADEAGDHLQLHLGSRVSRVEAKRVLLADGSELSAGLVIDSRGPNRATGEVESGYQKFVGLEIECARPHGVEMPVLMDARVEQVDGFRFFYLLPSSPTRLLVEDTRFSDSPELDVDELASEVHAYAASMGLTGYHVVRQEQGVLPMPLERAHDDLGEGPLPIHGGYQGGWFHPGTGYSFAAALRVAHFIARTPLEELQAEGLSPLEKAHNKQVRFFYRLNRMLFRWFSPSQRHHVLARFYTLPEASIRRFYAMQMTDMDRARVFLGRPPRGLSYRALFLRRKAQ